MTQDPMPQPGKPHPAALVPQTRLSDNGAGVGGLVLSVLGVASWGVLSPLGLLVSLIGLRKQPKTLAIAGTALGAAGTLYLVIFGWSQFTGMLGIGRPQETAEDIVARTETVMKAQSLIEQLYVRDGVLPDNDLGNAAIVGNKVEYRGEIPIYGVLSGLTYRLTMPGADKKWGTIDDRAHEFKVSRAMTQPATQEAATQTATQPDGAAQ
jgi:hypothetical protein